MIAIRKSCVLITFVLGNAWSLWAEEEEVPELVTDRPDQTESTAIVPPGFIQLETGWTHTEDNDEGEFHGDAIAESLLRVGLMVGSSRVDLQACKLEYSIVSPK